MSSTEIAPYEGGQADMYRPQIMTPEAARALDENLRRCTRAVLREGTDYGTVPGTNEKRFLFKPGAEKLLQWFGLAYSMHCIDTQHDDDGRREGVTYRCTVAKRLPDGTTAEIATCEGYAGYDEEKFYQSAEQAQRKAEAKERHWAAKDRRVANPEKWKHLTEYRAPWNTVVKMAQKRALVGATINATAAGGLFAEEDSSPDAPADGGPSYYQQAIGDAFSVTSKEAANELWHQANDAANTGTITPKQKNHIQNCIKLRVKELESHVQVDVTDLTTDASPAETAQDAPPSAPMRSAGEAPGVKADTLTAIGSRFSELGVDENDRLVKAAEILQLDKIPAHLQRLSGAQRAKVLRILHRVTSLGELNDLISHGAAPAEEVPDE